MTGFDLFSLAVEQGPIEVWPENWQAFLIFQRLQTQWRVDMGGATGLDYQVLYRLLDQAGLEGADWDEMLDDVQLMEIEALNTMHASSG